MSQTVNNPVLVEVKRGDLIENRHRGSYAVVDSEGDLIAAAGNYQQLIFARSSLKPLNVLAMLVSGAVDQFKVTDQEIALACASHNGEPVHVNLVGLWLERLGLTVDDLECGRHAPMGREANKQLHLGGQQPTPLHNACSGKHAGFLTLAKFLNQEVKGYSVVGSPLQNQVMQTAAEVLGIEWQAAPKGTDGCSIPMMGMPLIALAKGMARLAHPRDLRADLQEACARVTQSVQANPQLIAGTGRFCTDIIEKTEGKILVKMGADGVFTGWLPDKKWGIALRIDDGNLKAAEVAMADLLKRLKVLQNDDLLDHWIHQPIKTWTKVTVGQFQSGVNRV
jgi:L-asparaginase II